MFIAEDNFYVLKKQLRTYEVVNLYRHCQKQ